jgi:hypothetical protein
MPKCAFASLSAHEGAQGHSGRPYRLNSSRGAQHQQCFAKPSASATGVRTCRRHPRVNLHEMCYSQAPKRNTRLERAQHWRCPGLGFTRNEGWPEQLYETSMPVRPPNNLPHDVRNP